MSTVQAGPAFCVRTLQPVEVPSAPKIDRACSSGGARGRLRDRLHGRPWPPVVDFVALEAACACAPAWSGGLGARLRMAVFPFLGVLVLCLRRADAHRLRIVMPDSCGLAVGSVSAAAMCTLAKGRLVRSGDPGSGLLFRGWLPGAFLGCGTLPDKDLRFAHPDFGPATSGSARDSGGRTVR
jgi:hypothetical protein